MLQERLSIRQWVEFLFREGNIDSSQRGGRLADRGAEGSRIHRMLQKNAGKDYQAEVPLSLEIPKGEILYILEGRADGIFSLEDGSLAVDEIKTTEVSAEKITEDFQLLHWAQAKCYGYILAKQRDLETIAVQLTYYQTLTGEIRRFMKRFSMEELADTMDGMLEKYKAWAIFRKDWSVSRQSSASALAFPFPEYRPGQREMAAAVYRCIRDGKRLFCQAPTGIGKTMSAVFPAVKALGEGFTEKIFYLTARTTAGTAAWNAVGVLLQKGVRLKSLLLTAKDKICPMEEISCDPIHCVRAAGHYDRVNDAIYALLQEKDAVDRGVLEAYGEKYCVCPFELGLDLSLWCDFIICDYNYLFDPTVYLRRFFAESSDKYTFLIDEAHNLPDRARRMHTAVLRKSDLLELRREAGEDRGFRRILTRLNRGILKTERQVGEWEFQTFQEIPKVLLEKAKGFLSDCRDWLEKEEESPFRKKVLEFYFQVRFFTQIAELYDSHFITTVFARGKDVQITLLCLDPSELTDASMKKGRASVLFSATLSPVDYFQRMLGCEEVKRLFLPSPYPPENRRLFVADTVSTLYKDRQRTQDQVVDFLAAFISGRVGNYMFYFSSYQYMRQVEEAFCQVCPEVSILEQSPGMDPEQRQKFLDQFEEIETKTKVGFCVLGGVYAEGIDLKGEKLIGTAIVGVGLPQVNREQELLREYFDATLGDGFSFAYQYPGMNKVWQAAGRVIRSETDRGAVLLIDSRFSRYAYRQLFPAHWEQCKIIVKTPERLKKELETFWKSFQFPEAES